MALCTRLAWDSDFFGLNIARLEPERLTQEQMGRALAWCREQKIRCLYFEADSGHRDTIRLAEDNGFRLVDVRMVFTWRPAWGPVREVEAKRPLPDDGPELERIAGEVQRSTRFWFDPRFSSEDCRRLYRLWIKNSLAGWADKVFVVREAKRPVGYVTCHRDDGDAGRIGLVGVDAGSQGKGFGGALVRSAQSWCAGQNLKYLKVGTQARNLAPQRLYQACGFRIGKVSYWYHRWF